MYGTAERDQRHFETGFQRGRLGALSEAQATAYRARTLRGLRRALDLCVAREAARQQEVAYEASAAPEATR